MDYDLNRIYADLQTRQNQHAKEGWVIVQPPSNPPPLSNLKLQQIRFRNL